MASTPKVNINAKHHLARLLATENIWIQHQKVSTASFNLVNRILTFPMWKDMEEWLYTMLAAHEIGHALYSEIGKLIDFGAQIDPKNPEIAGMYWNVVEDARIERLVQETYPGLIHIFAKAYADLFERNLFGTKGRDLKVAPLIDRLNLYFKVGSHVDLEFSKEEQAFIDQMSKLLTPEDTIRVAKEIYEFSRHEHDQLKPPPQPGKGDSSDGDGEDTESKKQGKKKSKQKPKNDGTEKDKGKQKKSRSKDDGDDADADGEDEESGSGGDGEEGDEDEGEADGEGSGSAGGDEESEDDEDGDVPSNGPEATKPVDPGPPPAPFTQATYDRKIQDFNDPNADDVQYVTLPTPNLKNILVDHKKVHATIRDHDFSTSRWGSRTNAKDAAKVNAARFEQATKDFEEFRRINKPKVDYIFQQFMMKKQADRYKRTKQHKTGSLDPLRLHAYKIDEDLFKTIAIVSDDKNHGLIFVVDWSGSMQDSMAGTLEQLIVLCMFCRKAKIPFLVYSLTTGSRKAFATKPGNLVFADNFRMRCYLSSEMGASQFTEACINLFALMPGGTFQGGPTDDNLIGCTPLNESIIVTINLMDDFRRRTKAQVVNAIFMTDGMANTVSGYINALGQHESMWGKKFLIDDRETHKVYDFDYGEMTPTMLTILRDRQNINVVGFYIGGSWQGFFGNLDAKQRAVLTKQFNEDGFVISTEWGYNELYITKSGDRWRIKDIALEPDQNDLGTDKYMEKLGENFTERRKAMLKQRVMLDRFVKMIA